MKRFIVPFVALVLSAAACLPVEKAQADIIYVVAPNANATVEGDFQSIAPFRQADTTFQTVYAASQLTGIIGSQITGLTYRADGPSNSSAFPTADATFAQYNIQLSQSNFAPGSLSTTFANNIKSGTDVLVRSGALTVPAGSFPDIGAAQPNPFGFEFVFTTPYTYNGGDLLITTRHSGTNQTTRNVDAAISTTFAQTLASGGANATSGGSDGTPVVRLTAVSTPEPSTYAMMFVGLGMLVVAQRKKKKAAVHVA